MLIPDEYQKIFLKGAHNDDAFNAALDELTAKLADTDHEILLEIVVHLVARVWATQQDVDNLRNQVIKFHVEFMAKEDKNDGNG